jgi:uroporphyrin-III C-methyltransferase
MVEDAQGFGLRSPAILVIGEVVDERQVQRLLAVAG